MTGYRSSDLRHKCTTDGCLIDQLPSWDWMRGCFPRGCMPSDADGWIEIDGRILFIEQKRAGAALTPGQREAFKRLSNEPNCTVLFLRSTDSPEHYEVLIYGAGEPVGWQRWQIPVIQAWLTAWAAGGLGKDAA
jgi:hypothetical protein